MTTNDSPNDPIEDLTKIVLDTQAGVQAQFAQVDARFEQMEFRMARFETSQNALIAQQTVFATKLDKALDLLDGIASRITRDDTERVALSAQVTRHEDWIVDAAPVVGVTYTPGA